MNIQECLIKAYNILKQEEIDSYMLDAQLLLCKVLGKDKFFIITNKDYIMSEEEIGLYFNYIDKRKQKMPVKYILGKCEFMGIDFNIKQGVLIPRPDTEILVEEAIKEINENKFKNICDLCCGSGAIGLSVAKIIEDVNIDLFDISDDALTVTEQNINELKLNNRAHVEYSDLFESAIKNNKKYEMILSNPPYIREEVIPTLMNDVKDYEPYTALCGGEDGLYFYREITKQSRKVLLDGGVLVYEIGYDQKQEVSNILKENGYSDIKCIKDLSGNDRVVLGRLN